MRIVAYLDELDLPVAGRELAVNREVGILQPAGQ